VAAVLGDGKNLSSNVLGQVLGEARAAGGDHLGANLELMEIT